MPSFSPDIAKFVEKTKIRTEVVLRKLGFDAFAGVVKKSPVDTGRFRSNWRIGINTTDLTFSWAAPRGGPKGGSTPSGVETATATIKIGQAKWGDSIIIT